MMTAVVLLHGFLGDRRDALAVAQHVQQPVLALDLPGHGAEPLPRGGLPAAARQLWRRLDELGANRVLLCGYSLGGRLALHAALQAPERCAGLLMVSASPGLQTREERLARAQADDLLASELLARGLPAFLQRWYAQPLFAPLMQRADVANLLERRAQGDAPRLATALRRLSVGRQADLWPRLPTLPMPTCWMAGARDAKYTKIAYDAAGLSGGEPVVVPDVGHALWSEAPAAVARELQRMLDLAKIRAPRSDAIRS